MSAESDGSDLANRDSVPSDHPLSGPRQMPSGDWRDRLLALSCSLALQDPPEATIGLCLDALLELLPGCAVGARVRSVDGAVTVAVRVPAGDPGPSAPDSSRLFPDHAHEHVLPLDRDFPGGTLHVARRFDALADGETLQIAARAAAVLSAALRRTRTLQQTRQARDDLSRMHAKIIQAEKLASLGQLVAGVIHELNNPLTSIVAYSNYLKKKAQLEKDAEDAERLGRIQEAAQRVLEFTRHLVAYARPAPVSPGPVSLPAILDKALMFCEHEFAQKSVSVRRDFAEGLPAVRGVTGQLIQVFVNLFTNAAHATRNGAGELTVRVREAQDGGMLVTEVIDRGQGIAPSDMERIFEPFFTTKGDGLGTGLGLSIVREIVVSHGGSLTADSTLGQGTTFVVVLPKASS